MNIYVAYNSFGDLVATAHSYMSLVFKLENAGYELDDLFIGRTTP